jgi:hypothetical protein
MIDSATLFEQSIAALRLELTIKGCNEGIIARAVTEMREEHDWTREWLRKVERGTCRRNAFGCFRVFRWPRTKR